MEEMEKLREELDARGISWEDNSDWMVTRTRFTNSAGVECSVIFGNSVSYGWEEGLLEVMPPLHGDVEDEVEGWVSAEDILAVWC